MSWNEEKVQKLKELWGKGQTASQIAEILGGVSRKIFLICLLFLIFSKLRYSIFDPNFFLRIFDLL